MHWKVMISIVTMKAKNLNTIANLTDMSGSHTKDPVKMANQLSHFLLVLRIILQRITYKIQGIPYPV